jgi:cytochrome c oxidase subunit 2
MVVLMPRALLHVCLLVAVSGLAASARAGATAAVQDKPQVVEIDAERFSFSPSELRVKADTPVEFRLRSDDTDHGFRIVGTDVNVTIPKRGRGTATVTFVPPKAGRYIFECSKVCGAGHAFMRGTLIAE